eukprot:gb/GEZN01009140.1/.p1 GENE.gb/GEZN01009140.1/~~gb/GEZN01009140.1/.p1  ORF type:complete len:437 (-),score=59.32 gb/GEZN01009140.1/:25-1335(-)
MSLEEFGLILPTDASFKEWHGYLQVQGHEFKVQLSKTQPTQQTNKPNKLGQEKHKQPSVAEKLTADQQPAKKRQKIQGQGEEEKQKHEQRQKQEQERERGRSQASLKCDVELYELLRNYHGLVQTRLTQSAEDLGGFLTELQHIVRLALRDQSHRFALPPPAFYTQILEELEEVGWSALCGVDSSLSGLSLEFSDRAGRTHHLNLKLPDDYPNKPPQVSCDLPLELSLSWAGPSSGRGLASVLSQYQAATDKLQNFFSVMEDWDSHVWVLEPSLVHGPAPRAATSRRVALAKACSLQVQIDPEHPRAVPECRFFGSEASVQPLLAKLQQRCFQLWDVNQFPRLNLQCILQVDFPSPSSSKQDDYLSLECGICYCYELEGVTPERVCDKESCQRPFHRACLYQWLRALPTSRQSFHTVFGYCPYCSDPISCSAKPSA